LAGAVLVVPVMEELFWRSFAMRWIQDHDFLAVPPSRVGLKALGIGAVLFGLEHHLWFAGILAGLAYGWLYLRTGNLWVPILSHAVTNGLLGAWVLYTRSWEFW
jgi:CAAX protease family protein